MTRSSSGPREHRLPVDTHIRAANPISGGSLAAFAAGRGSALGVEFAGDVEAVGLGRDRVPVGDAVFGHPSTWFGAHAEFICIRRRAAVHQARRP